MRDHRTLFEKLKEPDPVPLAKRDRTVLRSVLLNLRRILNTRHGNSLSAPDYGIIDLASVVHNYPESIDEMVDSIRVCIRQYEPRLTGVSVSYDKREDDVLKLRFQISAMVQLPGSDRTISFDTLVSSTGRVEVTS